MSYYQLTLFSWSDLGSSWWPLINKPIQFKHSLKFETFFETILIAFSRTNTQQTQNLKDSTEAQLRKSGLLGPYSNHNRQIYQHRIKNTKLYFNNTLRNEVLRLDLHQPSTILVSFYISANRGISS